VAGGRAFEEEEVGQVNYIDIAIAIILALAFLRGFASGLWKAAMNLIVGLISFVASYILSGPVLLFLDGKYNFIASMSSWTQNVFPPLPGLGLPYDPATFDQIFQAIRASGWLGALKGSLQANMAQSAALAGPNPTWGQVIAVSVSHFVASGIVFLVLLAIFNAVGTILSRSLSWALPTGIGVRLLGGLIETGISVVWLSLLAGTLYPVFTAGFLQSAKDAVNSSYLMTLLLGVYRSLWPVIVARIRG
jgi:hypothetical protein